MSATQTTFKFIAALIAMAGVDSDSAAQATLGSIDLTVIAAKPHPRTLTERQLIPSEAALLVARVRRNAQVGIPIEPDVTTLRGPSGPAREQAMHSIAQVASGEEGRLLLATIAWHAGRDAVALKDARRRALNLASWSPRGATGYYFQDQAGRSIAWSLALAYDWLYFEWSPEERRQLLDAIIPRVEDMLAKPVLGYPTGWAALDWGKKLDRWPYDSHGVTTLARLAVICTALAGEDGLFDRCVREIVPRYVARPVPWGGADGGFANGTAYAHWGALYTYFVVWHLLKPALGADLWESAWAKGYLNFIAYFLPPGTPSGLFGNETEKRFPDVWATQAKAYAARRPSPLADWYARNQFSEDALHLSMLLAPPRDWLEVSGQLPPGTPHAVHLADIGWVAMHSDLGDRARTSVYFKSSPYGSYNHSHADQNSFVIHARGRALAIDSGYYDAYNSPHWRDWYKQTRAHNAITFDAGNGQLHDTMAAKGRITRFQHHADYDVATGDATEAYGGALTRAVRTLVYLRPNTVLVHDSLTSDAPRTWEWNLHALSRMKDKNARALEIEQDGVRLCVQVLEAPDGAFSQTDRFTTEPHGDYPKQWHARYATVEKSREARFLALLDVECRNPAVSLQRRGADREIAIDGRKFLFSEDGNAQFMP